MKNECPIGLMIKTIDTIFETETNKELSELKLTLSQLVILMYIELQTEKEIEVNQIDIVSCIIALVYIPRFIGSSDNKLYLKFATDCCRYFLLVSMLNALEIKR